MEISNKKILQSLITEVIYEVSNISLDSMDINLLDSRLNMKPSDFIYIFDILEKKTGLPVVDLFKNHDYTIMTVENITNAMFQLSAKTN